MKSILILEDEKSSQTRAKEFIQEIGGYSIVGVCGSISDSVKSFNQHKPNILLLDVQLIGGTAFDVLAEVDISETALIFTTAYNRYAVKAFELCAIHYLLKPFKITDLEKALTRFEQLNRKSCPAKSIVQLTHNLATNDINEKLVSFRTINGRDVFSIKEIIRIEAEGNTCLLFTSDGKRVRVFEQLKFYEERLANTCFFRSHKSHMVNLGFVRRVSTKNDLVIELRTGDTVPLSVRRKPELLRNDLFR